MKTISIIILSMIMIACGGNVASDNERLAGEGIQSNTSEEVNPLDTNILGGPLEDATTGTGDTTGVLPAADPNPTTGTLIPTDGATITGSATIPEDNITIDNPTNTTTNSGIDILGLISNATNGTNNVSNPLLSLLDLGQTSNMPNLNNLIGTVLNGGNGTFPGNTTQNFLFCSALCSFNTGVSGERPLLNIMTLIKQPICGC